MRLGTKEFMLELIDGAVLAAGRRADDWAAQCPVVTALPRRQVLAAGLKELRREKEAWGMLRAMVEERSDVEFLGLT